MRKTLSASALLLALCVSTFAGDITNPPATSPQSVPRTSGLQTVESWDGDPAADGIFCCDAAEGIKAAALAALDGVLALL